jgi:hypothetical protein
MQPIRQLDIQLRTSLVVLRHALDARLTEARRGDDRGEGVISTALAVLIVAFLGVAAYALFRTLLDDSGNAARSQIQHYGGS